MLDPQIRDLAQAKNFAALTVIPKGGHPMNHIMWVDADEDHGHVGQVVADGLGHYRTHVAQGWRAHLHAVGLLAAGAAHVMWIDADDECLLINTEIGRAKATAMDHDPRVTIAIWDSANPYHYAEVRGRVVSTAAGQPAADHINKLAGKYVGGPYTFGPTDQRIIYFIEPIRQRLT